MKFKNLPPAYLQDLIANERLIKNDPACSDLISTTLHSLGSTRRREKESKILSLGGDHTRNRVIEVFNTQARPKKIYQNVPANAWNSGCALKLNEFVYAFGTMHLSVRKYGKSCVEVRNCVARLKLGKQKLVTEGLAPMEVLRSDFSAAVFCDGIVVTGGCGTIRGFSESEHYCWKLDQARKIASTNEAPYHHILVSCRNCLYNIGGKIKEKSLDKYSFIEGKVYISALVERLQDLEGKWEFVESLQTERCFHAGVSCNGYIYVMGGTGASKTSLSSVEKYDPSSNTWTYVKDMIFPRAGHSACVLNGKIYVVGGKDSNDKCIKEIECYDSHLDSWIIVGSVEDNLYKHSLVVF